MNLIIAAIVSLLGGLGLGVLARNFLNKQTIKRAQEEAQELLAEAQELVEMRTLEEQERTQEIEMELWTKVEKDMLKSEEKIEQLQELVDEKKSKADLFLNEEKKKTQEFESAVKTNEQRVKSLKDEFDRVKNQVQELNQQFVHRLTEKLGTTQAEVKAEIQKSLETEAQQRALKLAQAIEEDAKEHAEVKAKRILALSIDRFARPYCPERGIGAVNFPDPQSRKILCDAAGVNIKTIEEITGCDVIIQDDMDMIGVAGFDPVRRELTRRVLEKLLKEKRPVNPEFIKKVAENQKKELFRTIQKDGDLLAKELKLEGLHSEVRQMMGSLRYRYSFTQNQYFHCGEVGWLSGLLAAELNIDIKSARRSGMLHDIGKAMDHAMDGGHAVIGADFIQARGESPEIVHNVRAHHFDEQPTTDHAFLVIAADAISGARPGARRSTIESYNQKVSELQEIARSFEGVTDCFVLSGGRECRVLVNGRKYDDKYAMSLSRQIAAKIEEECSYPGSIKVVVVRETVVTESTAR
ncbi:MAG: Rnase Y domain-containing protein [Bdellovibrionia bacterium]